MGEDPENQDRVGGRFQASTTHDDVLRVFDQVRGPPVVTSSDVAQACDCSAKTARRKLDELADQGRVEGRETAGRTVWWRVDDDGEQLVTDGGYLEAARSAGAHDEYIAFVAEYPESSIAEGLETAISLDALDEFKSVSGSFEWALWDRGASAASNADTGNAERMRQLFSAEQLPEVLRE